MPAVAPGRVGEVPVGPLGERRGAVAVGAQNGTAKCVGADTFVIEQAHRGPPSLTVRRGRGASLDEWGAPRARRGSVALTSGLRRVIGAVTTLRALRLPVVVDALAAWAYD